MEDGGLRTENGKWKTGNGKQGMEAVLCEARLAGAKQTLGVTGGLVRQENGEWRMEHGEWRTENGKRRMETATLRGPARRGEANSGSYRKLGENGEWRMENGEWRTENGEWKMETATLRGPARRGEANSCRNWK